MQASEQAGKRPLSYETANQIPHRQPPGPPTTTYYVPNQNLPPTSSSAGELHWPQQGYQPPVSSTVSPEMPPPYELSTGPNQQYGLSPGQAQQYPTAAPPPPPPAVTTTPYAPQLPMTTANTGDFADFLLDDTAFLNIVSPATPMNGSGAAYGGGAVTVAAPASAPAPAAGPGQIPVAPAAPPWPLQPAPPPPTVPQQGQNIALPQTQHHHHHHHSQHHPHSHPHLHHQPHHGQMQTWFDASAGNM